MQIFWAATMVGLLHAIDDAVLHRQPGVPVHTHLPALLVVTVGAALALMLFERVGTGIRAGLALAVGTLSVANGGLHVLHVTSSGEVSGSDLTGLLAAMAGGVLMVMSVALPVAHRGERHLSWWRRWGVRVGVVGILVAAVPFGLLPISIGIVQTTSSATPSARPRPASPR